MKAKEAPEKIYVNITHPISDEYTEMIAFEDGDGIEYIRADAFIKKASFWLECNLSDRPVEDRKFWVEDFVNYMKGE